MVERPNAQAQSAVDETLIQQIERVFVVLNPVGGHSNPAQVMQILQQQYGPRGIVYDVYETTTDDNETTARARAAADEYDVVVAAGGDGTVSMVANAIAGHDAMLGILPVGTANVLALELGIPQDVSEAANILVDDHRLRELDMMKVGDRSFILQIGIGIDSLMIKDTNRQAKRLFGRLAYMTTLIGKLFGYKSRRFTIVVDGQRLRPRAWQLLVANAGTLGVPPFKWGPNIFPSDGELDLCIFNVRRPIDYIRLIRQIAFGKHETGSNISYVRIHKQIIITADRPLPIQADGEIIGETPVQISVVPHRIRVIVPAEAKAASVISVARKADDNDE